MNPIEGEEREQVADEPAGVPPVVTDADYPTLDESTEVNGVQLELETYPGHSNTGPRYEIRVLNVEKGDHNVDGREVRINDENVLVSVGDPAYAQTMWIIAQHEALQTGDPVKVHVALTDKFDADDPEWK